MKKALTVGELLVTMTIIGIIAALVIPGFLKDYNNKLYSARIKKAYGMIISAIEESCSDSGVSYFYQTPYGASTSSTDHKTFLENYFKIVKNSSSIFASSYDVFGEKSEEDEGVTVPSSKVRLKSGEAIAMSCTTGVCTFIVDINSVDRPNVGGRDLFTFNIDTTKNQLVIDSTKISKCGTDAIGTGCFDKIVENDWTITY